MNLNRSMSLTLVISMILTLFVSFNAFAQAEWDPFNGDKDVNVVFIGGSITAGDGYRSGIGDYLIEKYSNLVEGRTIKNYNAGIGGTGSYYGFMRLDRDVISKKPDLVFVEFAVNDGVDKETAMFGMEGIVRSLQSLENPPMIVFVYTSGPQLKNNSDKHQPIADYYQIPVIDFRQHMIDDGYKGTDAGLTYEQLPSKLKMLYGDIIHPNSEGGKLWTKYAVADLSADPKACFKYPKINKEPLTSTYKYINGMHPVFVGAADALNNGTLNVGGYHKEYSDGAMDINETSTLTYDFEGNLMIPMVKTSVNGGYANILIADSSVSERVNTYFTAGADTMAVKALNLADGKHTITIKGENNIPDGSSGKNISVLGFFKEGEKYKYPTEYPDYVVRHNEEIKETKTEETKTVENYEEYQSDLNIAYQLRILNETQKLSPAQEMTRKELAYAIVNIVSNDTNKVDKWKEAVFKTDGNDTVIERKKDTNTFIDVRTDNEYYDAVEKVNIYGYMGGVSSNTFDLDGVVTIAQISAVLVKMLGYNILAQEKGGYPNGYIAIASELGLLKGIDVGEPSKAINIATFAKILKNTYKVKIMFTSYQTQGASIEKSEETFLKYYMDYSWISGLMSQTPITSLTTANNSNKFVVGGYELNGTANSFVYIDYIGRDVEAIYNKDNEMVYAFLNEKDEVTSIEFVDVNQYSKGILQYFENDSNKSISIKKDAYLLHNGISINTFDENLFSFKKGYIQIIETTKGEQIVSVSSYEDWVVASNDINSKVLYRKGDSNNRNLGTLDYGNLRYIRVADEKDNIVDIASLSSDSIISVCRNIKSAKILLSNVKVDAFNISEIEKNNELIVVKNGSASYEVLSNYYDSGKMPNLFVGNTYKLYIDVFGYIVWAEQTVTSVKQGGVIKQFYAPDNNVGNLCEVEVVDFSGKVKQYKISDKLKVVDNLGITKILKYNDEIKEYFQGFQGFAEFVLNDKKEVKEFDLPRTVIQSTDDEDTVYDILKVLNVSKTDFRSNSTLNVWIGEYAKIYFTPSFTQFLYCPDSIEEKKYKGSTSVRQVFPTADPYSIKAYGNIKSSTAKYIVCTTERAAVTATYDLFANVYYVNKVYKTVNEDGETVDAIDGTLLKYNGSMRASTFYSKLNEVELPNGTTSLIMGCTDVLRSKDDIGVLNRYKVNKGDLIGIVPSGNNVGYMLYMYMLYKTDAYAPGSEGYGRKGWIVGAKSTYADNDIYSNPYSIGSTGNLYTDAKLQSNWSSKILRGYVVSYIDGVMKITTQDLSTGAFIENEPGYITEFVKKFSGSDQETYCIDYTTGEVRKATDSDIRSYDDYGNNASQILFLGRGTTWSAIIINGEN